MPKPSVMLSELLPHVSYSRGNSVPYGDTFVTEGAGWECEHIEGFFKVAAAPILEILEQLSKTPVPLGDNIDCDSRLCITDFEIRGFELEPEGANHHQLNLYCEPVDWKWR